MHMHEPHLQRLLKPSSTNGGLKHRQNHNDN